MRVSREIHERNSRGGRKKNERKERKENFIYMYILREVLRKRFRKNKKKNKFRDMEKENGEKCARTRQYASRMNFIQSHVTTETDSILYGIWYLLLIHWSHMSLYVYIYFEANKIRVHSSLGNFIFDYKTYI